MVRSKLRHQTNYCILFNVCSCKSLISKKDYRTKIHLQFHPKMDLLINIIYLSCPKTQLIPYCKFPLRTGGCRSQFYNWFAHDDSKCKIPDTQVFSIIIVRTNQNYRLFCLLSQVRHSKWQTKLIWQVIKLMYTSGL